MAIKKAYLEVVNFLEENAGKKVSTILDQVKEMCSAKQGGGGSRASTFFRDGAGNVVAILCYYHKVWMDPRVAEFGTKASSATGLNSMCKDGMSKWTKQQAAYKKGKEELLDNLASGEIDQADLPEALAGLDKKKDEIVPREDEYGFATLEECLADSVERGLEVVPVEGDATAEEADAE